jgi:hypothetical protein
MPAGNSPLYKGCPRLTVTRVTRARAATDAPPTPNPPTVALGMLKAGGLRARMKGETDATAGGAAGIGIIAATRPPAQGVIPGVATAMYGSQRWSSISR